MSNTVTARFESNDQATNAEDELRSSGIPSEKIYVDKAAKTIKVLIPEATRPGVIEILQRHRLTGITP